jgi:hypothetical protein
MESKTFSDILRIRLLSTDVLPSKIPISGKFAVMFSFQFNL